MHLRTANDIYNYLLQSPHILDRIGWRFGSRMVFSGFEDCYNFRYLWREWYRGEVVGFAFMVKLKTHEHCLACVAIKKGGGTRTFKSLVRYRSSYSCVTSPRNIAVNKALEKADSTITGYKTVNTSNGKRRFLKHYVNRTDRA